MTMFSGESANFCIVNCTLESKVSIILKQQLYDEHRIFSVLSAKHNQHTGTKLSNSPMNYTFTCLPRGTAETLVRYFK